MNNQKLESAYDIAGELLEKFLTDVDFVAKLNLAFENGLDLELARDLIEGLIARDIYPEVEIIASSEINGANGAFAGSLNKVFLAQEFVDGYGADDIAFLLLEELGHYLDWQLNEDDTGGDEGAIFSALVRGETLTQSELQQLQNEDDWATVSVGGVEIAIEQQQVIGSSENNILNVRVSGFAGDVIRVDLRTALTPEQRTQNPSFSWVNDGTPAGVAVDNNRILTDEIRIDEGTPNERALTFAETGVFYFVPEIRFDAHPPELTDNDETNDNINGVNFQETALSNFRIDFDNDDFELGNLNINIEAGYSPFSLSGSVGEGVGQNNLPHNDPLDVYRVEQRLRYLGFPDYTDESNNNAYPPGNTLIVDGQITSQIPNATVSTNEAIRLFQATTVENGIGNPLTTTTNGQINNDNNNDNLDTIQWLNASNATRWVELIDPDIAPGIATTDGNFEIFRDQAQWERFGTNWTRDIIIEATDNVENTQLITAISEYGQTDDHSEHKAGLDIDVQIDNYTNFDESTGDLVAPTQEQLDDPNFNRREHYIENQNFTDAEQQILREIIAFYDAAQGGTDDSQFGYVFLGATENTYQRMRNALNILMEPADGTPATNTGNQTGAARYIGGHNNHYHISLLPPERENPTDIAANNLGDARLTDAIDFNSNLGVAITEFIDPDDTDDYYKLEVNEDIVAVSIFLDGLNANADVRLISQNGIFDEYGTQVDSSENDGTESESIYQTLEQGTYYIHVYNPIRPPLLPTEYTNYTLTVYQENNPSTSIIFREDSDTSFPSLNFWEDWWDEIKGWDHVGLSFHNRVYESHKGYETGNYWDIEKNQSISIDQTEGVQQEHQIGSFQHNSTDPNSSNVIKFEALPIPFSIAQEMVNHIEMVIEQGESGENVGGFQAIDTDNLNESLNPQAQKGGDGTFTSVGLIEWAAEQAGHNNGQGFIPSELEAFNKEDGTVQPTLTPQLLYDAIKNPIAIQNAQKWLQGFLDPVDFIITAPDGKRLGYVDGQEYREIPNAFYIGDGIVEEFVIVNPEPGDYQVELFGVGEDAYAAVGGLSIEGKSFSGNLNTGDTHTFTVTVPESYTGNNLCDIIEGIDNVFDYFQELVNSEIYSLALPLLGNKLQNSAEDTVQFITQIHDNIIAPLEIACSQGNFTSAIIQTALIEGLGPNGINILPDFNGDGIINRNDIQVTETADDIKFNLPIGGFSTFNTSLDTNIGFPGLGLEVEGDAEIIFNYGFNLGFGVNKDNGFYFDTSSDSEIEIGLEASIPGLDATGSLAFLQLNVKDDEDDPSNINAGFTVDITDPNNDGKLTLSEITEVEFDTKLGLETDVNLELNAGFDDEAKFPSIGTDFNLDWSFGDAVVDPDNPQNLGNKPTIAFNNVTLDLGEFFSDFASPILDTVQKITEPVQPVIDVLTKEIDLKLAKFSLLDVAEEFGFIDQDDRDFIDSIAQLVNVINSIPTGSNIEIDLGGFDFGDFDIRQPDFNISEVEPNIPEEFNLDLQIPENSPEKEFVTELNKIPGEGLQFPLLTDPKKAFNLLLGKDVEVFTYDLPKLQFLLEYSQYFPIFGPLGVRLEGNVGAGIDFAFGFDTYGLRQFVEGNDGEIGTGDDFNNAGKIFNGFYVSDTENPDGTGFDIPEVTITGGFGASAEVNIGVAKAGAGGGLYADVGFNLNDPNDDGKVRVEEFVDLIDSNPLCLFDVEGELYARLYAYFKIGVGFLSVKKRFNGPSLTLLDFNSSHEDCDNQNPPPNPPILATNIGNGVLRLNMGPHAAARIHHNIEDGAEVFIVQHVSGSAGNETLRISAFGTREEHSGITKIEADGGEEFDIIELNDSILTPAKLSGGNGEDLVIGGGGDDSLYGNNGFDELDGGKGNDKLYGGNDDDKLIGGEGADTLDGGGGEDVASYFTAKAGVKVNIADPTQNTGDAAGDVYISIELIEVSPYDDTLIGNGNDDLLSGLEGNDVVEGAGGNDILDGVQGDDTLRGGSGDDTIAGGQGSDVHQGGTGFDIATYADSSGGIVLDLANPSQSTGYAEGDTFESIEKYEATHSNDTLQGDGQNNYFSALMGDDQLYGNGGNDTLEGNEGDDTLFGGEGADILDGGENVQINDQPLVEDYDIASYEDSPNAVVIDLANPNNSTGYAAGDTFIDIEEIQGSTLDDTIRGNNQDNIFDGLDGNNTIIGGGGADDLRAGLGNDTYQLNANNAAGSIIKDRGGNNDTLILDNITLSLAAASAGIAGLGRSVNDLIIDINQDGIINGNEDLTIEKFFSPRNVRVNDVSLLEGDSGIAEAVFTVTTQGSNSGAGIGLIETLDNLSGIEIIELLNSINVDYATVDNTAIANQDYIPESGTLTFAQNETEKTVTVGIIGDLTEESNERFYLDLSNATSNIIDDRGIGTIRNDDTSISIGNLLITEGDNGNVTATLNVSLSRPTFKTVTVDYQTQGQTASGNIDYTQTSGKLTFNPGETRKQIQVEVTGETEIETNETFLVNLSNATNGDLVDNQAVVTIVNDDFADITIDDVSLVEGDGGTKNANFTVTLSQPSAQPVSVRYSTANDTAFVALDYLPKSGILTFQPGETSKTIPVRVIGDRRVELNEKFLLKLSNPINGQIVDNQGVGTIRNDDLVEIDINKIIVTEGDSGTKQATFTVQLSDISPELVTVDYATADDTATENIDYNPISGSLSFAPFETQKTITVDIIGDEEIEDDERFLINLSNASNAIMTEAQTVGIIRNDDVPNISITDATLIEGNSGTNVVLLNVTLSETFDQQVTVEYATENGTAIANLDYITANGTLIFDPGEDEKTIAVQIKGETLIEEDETFSVILSNARQAEIADNEALVTIENDDFPSITISDVTVSESDSTAEITVSLSEASPSPVTVNYSTANNSATAGNDYVAESGTLTFAANQTSQTINVNLLGDTFIEGNESFFVNLSNASSNAILADSQGIVTIEDNDFPSITISDVIVSESDSTAEITVSLSEASPFPITVNYSTANNSATAGNDYVAKSGTLSFAANQTIQTISVNLLEDTSIEGEESFFINLSNSSSNATIADNQGIVTINDNDFPSINIGNVTVSESDNTAQITVSLSEASPSPVTVNYSTANNSATAGNDYVAKSGTLTFAANQTSKTISVNLLEDTLIEGTERFFVNLSNASSNAILADSQGVVTIQDNDFPSITISDVTVSESDSSAQITVSLSAASPTPVTVNYSTANNSATAGNDYVAKSGTLSFAANQTIQTITLNLLEDTSIEGEESFFINLSNSSSNATIADNQGIVTINDNDFPSINIGNVTVSESDNTAQITVSLSEASPSPVTVNYSTANNSATAGNDYVAKSGTLSFAANQTIQTITLNLLEDTSIEGEESFFINLSNSSSNATIADNQGIVTINDNDFPSINIGNVTVSESDNTAQITVSLSEASPSPVTVNYSTANNSATAGNDYVAKSGTLSFAANQTIQTISVNLVNDDLVEGNENFFVNLSNASNNANITDSQGIVTIEDDDDNVPANGIIIDFKTGRILGDHQGITVIDNLIDSNGDGYHEIVLKLNYQSGFNSSKFLIEYDKTPENWTVNIGDSPTNNGYGGDGGDTSNAAEMEILGHELRAYSNVLPGYETVTDGGLTLIDVDNFVTGASTVVLEVRDEYLAWNNQQGISGNLNSPYLYTLNGQNTTYGSINYDIYAAFNRVIASRGRNGSGVSKVTIQPTVVNIPDITINNVTVSESNSTAQITVSLSEAISSPVTVNYSTANSTARSGLDYVAKSGILTFAANQTSKTISVNLLPDNLVEGTERFFVNLSNASSNATIADNQGIVTIEDNDFPSITISDVTVSESNSTAEIRVSLSEASPTPVTVNYSTANNSARSGLDYVAKSGTLTFAANQTSKTITVNLLGDTAIEGTERFFVNLSNASGNATIADNQGIVTIEDNDFLAMAISDVTVSESDSSAEITLSLSKAISSPVTVDYSTANNSATASNDYVAKSGTLTFAANQTSQTISVNLLDDNSVEGNETFFVNLSNPSVNGISNQILFDSQGVVTIQDNDLYSIDINNVTVSESNSTAQITVSLSEASPTPVTVNYSTANSTARSGLDYVAKSGILTFAANQTSKTISVNLLSDNLVEGTERFFVNLSNASSNATIADNQGIVTIEDNDFPSITISDVTVPEVSNTAQITVSLSAASPTPVTVNYSTANNTATAGNDYVAKIGTLTFAANQTSQTISVNVLQDLLREGFESFFVNLSNASSNATITDSQGIVTIVELVIQSEELFEDPLTEPTILISEAAENQILPVPSHDSSGEIKGQIWYDQNNNSNQEQSELGLEGWLVYLDLNQNAKFDFDEPFAITDENGNYSFSHLETATYTVRQFINEGWTQTYRQSYTNGDFESGDFTDWSTTGDYNIEPTSADADFTLGNFQAQITSGQGSVLVNELESFLGLTSGSLNDLSDSFESEGTIRRNVTEGSAIAQNITVSAGDRLTFDYNFLTNDYLPYNDFAFFSVSSATTERIASIQSDLEVSATNFVEETGFGTFSHTFTESGTFTIGVGVVDIGDRIVDSALLIDNFTLTSNNYIIEINGEEIIDNINFGNYLPNLPQTIQFSAANYIVNEDTGEAEITLTRSGDTSIAANITVQLNNGTAQGGIDFDGTSQTINFAAEETSKTITIPITNDNLVELDENFILSLTNPSNAEIGAQNTAIVTIIDNETSVEFSQPTYQINEDGTPEGIEITVIRSGDLNLSSSVELAFSDGTAIGGTPFIEFEEDEFGETILKLVFPEGVDFDQSQAQLPTGETINTRKVFFDRGEDSKTFTFPINDDNLLEGSEYFTLSLTNPIGATLGNQESAEIEIIDNENGEISGSVWDDVNGNGIWEIGELGLANWTIYIDSNNNGQLDAEEISTLSNPNGFYSFDNLTAGEYTIALVTQFNWQQTYPTVVDGFTHNISLNQGEQITQINFGNQDINNPPTVEADKNLTVTEDTITELAIALPTDSDGDTLTVKLESLPDNQKGIVELANGNPVVIEDSLTLSQLIGLRFNPLMDVNGSAGNFTYSVSDGRKTVSSTITIDITAVNDSPIAVDDNVTTDKDTSINIEVLANDTDPENDILTLNNVIITNNTQGNVTINPDGTVNYDPNDQFDYLQVGETATDTFSYTIVDEFGAISNSATVTVTIEGISDGNNNPPVLTNPIRGQRLRVSPITPTSLGISEFTFAEDTFVDPDAGDVLTYTAEVLNGVRGWTRRFVNGVWDPVATGWNSATPIDNDLASGPIVGLSFDPATRTFQTYTNDRKFYWVRVTATDSFGEEDVTYFDFFNRAGSVIDNYIVNSNVFLDLNNNGQYDEDEPFGISGENGQFNFGGLSIVEYDLNQNGTLDADEVSIVAIGGIDNATGLPLETPLRATPDATVVTLLTTLVAEFVDQGLTIEEANTSVTNALSIPAVVEINNLDPIEATTNNQLGGVETFEGMVKVQNLITQTTALIMGASDLSNSTVVNQVVKAIASEIQINSILNLTDVSQIETIINDSATGLEVDISNLATQAAQVMVASNEKIEEAVVNLPTSDLEEAFAKVQKVALGETSQDLQKAGAGIKSIADVVNENTGNALDEQINNAQVLSQPPTDIILSNKSVTATQPIGTEVGILTTVDPDVDETHTYSLVLGEGDTDNDKFEIVGDRLLTKDTFDDENQDSYSIRVLTSDGNGGIYIEQFTINRSPIPTLDIDGNGTLELQDYNLIDLYAAQLDETEFDFLLNNFSGDLRGENATRTDADSILTYLREAEDSLFDIDGNGVVELQDYNLIDLYAAQLDEIEMGFLLDNFASDLIGENGTRTDAASIMAYFETITL